MLGLPDLHATFTLVLTAAALYLFTRDELPLEASALAILVVLLLVFQLFPYERGGQEFSPERLLSGFGHEALIAISALMIVGKGVEATGALQPLALSLAHTWLARPRGASLITLVIAAILSAFVINTQVVVMLLPMLIGVAARSNLPPSAILMPVGFATLLGGMATTIGTSSNLLVVSIAADLGAADFRMFDFSLPVLAVGGVGMLYLWLAAPRLLPARKPPLADTSPRVFNATFHIADDSAACGRTFAECLALTRNEMRVDRIERGEGLVVTKLPLVRIQAGDRLVVRDTPERLKEFEKRLGATMHDEAVGNTGTFAGPIEQEQLAEIVVTRGSMLHRASLAATRFAERSGLLPLALHRARAADGEELDSHIGLVPLRAGDIVLVQGTPRQLERLKRSGTALVLDGTTDLPRTHRADRALTILVFVVVAAALDAVPISVSALIGVGLMLATRCLAWKDLGGALSVPMIMVVVTSLALGQALNETGAASMVAQGFVDVTGALPVPVILSVMMLVLTLLANFVSTNAVGIIAAPIAVQAARELGVPPEPFLLGVLFSANMSYATPFGYQTNLLLLSSGGYRYADFLKVGVPLTLIMWLGFSVLLPVLYGL